MSTDGLSAIVEAIRQKWALKSAARDVALQRSRELTRFCATAIRASHRNEFAEAESLLASARAVAREMQADLAGYPDLLQAGYTQDSLKEMSEAHILVALVSGRALPTPESLGVEDAAYLNGLGEAAGELRRHTLDLIREGQIDAAERFLAVMDDIYTELMTLDFPDALTSGLRRTSDMVRGVVERTRGDLTTAVRQEELQEALQKMEARLRASASSPGQ